MQSNAQKFMTDITGMERGKNRTVSRTANPFILPLRTMARKKKPVSTPENKAGAKKNIASLLTARIPIFSPAIANQGREMRTQ